MRVSVRIELSRATPQILSRHRQAWLGASRSGSVKPAPDMARPPYEIEFYEDEEGDLPVRRWLTDELTPQKRRALGTAMNEILQHEGPNVVGTNFGKALGGGLFEFRLDQDIEQILSRKGKRAKKKDTTGDAGRILLRVFFHPHGDKIILLVGGYDKAEHTSQSYQQSQIELARQRLAAWKARERQVRIAPGIGKRKRS